jgi:hypothetical protein
MCTVSAKYLPSFGWVIAKNRDQDYVSAIEFEDEPEKTVGEILLMYDKNTGYREGMNYKGMSIITASLTPNLNDETDRADGEKIRLALLKKSPEEAAKFLISKKVTGFIFIATSDKLLLIEAGKIENDKGEYHSQFRVVPKTETIVRTNHGIELPWAGFQYGINDQQDIWRKSSESRKKYAEKALKSAKTPLDMLDALAAKSDTDLQMNQFRVEYKPRQMRTIFQWALVPKEDKAYIRPIQCKMKLRVTKEKISIDVLDNKIIRKNFPTVKHLCKLKLEDGGKYIVASENRIMKYKEFVNEIFN